jgi:hypothetical protein
VISKRGEAYVRNVVWGEFVGWCLHKNLKPISAHAWPLAAYSLTLEGKMSPAQIRKCLARIGKAHAEKYKTRPDRDPLVEKTIKIIEKRNDQKVNVDKILDDEDFSDPAIPTVKKLSLKKKAPGLKTKKPQRRVMRRAPKLVRKLM